MRWMMLPVAAGRCQEKGGAGTSVTVSDCPVVSRTVAPLSAAVRPAGGLAGWLGVPLGGGTWPLLPEVRAGLAEPPEPLLGPVPGLATLPQATTPLVRSTTSAAEARLSMYLGRGSDATGSGVLPRRL